MDKKIIALIHIVVPLFLLHILEEVITGFYKIDLSIQHLSQYLKLSTEITYFLIQIALLLFLSILLVLILSKKQISNYLLLALTIISLYEFTHTYEMLKHGTYYSGAITGTIIGVIGCLLLYRIFKFKSWN